MKFIGKISEKKEKLVDSLLTRDEEDISNLLAFIRSHITSGRDERGHVIDTTEAVDRRVWRGQILPDED